MTASSLPSRIECGAPDFVITKGSTTIGYVKAKNAGRPLDEIKQGEGPDGERFALLVVPEPGNEHLLR